MAPSVLVEVLASPTSGSPVGRHDLAKLKLETPATPSTVAPSSTAAPTPASSPCGHKVWSILDSEVADWLSDKLCIVAEARAQSPTSPNWRQSSWLDGQGVNAMDLLPEFATFEEIPDSLALPQQKQLEEIWALTSPHSLPRWVDTHQLPLTIADAVPWRLSVPEWPLAPRPVGLVRASRAVVAETLLLQRWPFKTSTAFGVRQARSAAAVLAAAPSAAIFQAAAREVLKLQGDESVAWQALARATCTVQEQQKLIEAALGRSAAGVASLVLLPSSTTSEALQRAALDAWTWWSQPDSCRESLLVSGDGAGLLFSILGKAVAMLSGKLALTDKAFKCSSRFCPSSVTLTPSSSAAEHFLAQPWRDWSGGILQVATLSDLSPAALGSCRMMVIGCSQDQRGYAPFGLQKGLDPASPVLPLGFSSPKRRWMVFVDDLSLPPLPEVHDAYRIWQSRTYLGGALPSFRVAPNLGPKWNLAGKAVRVLLSAALKEALHRLAETRVDAEKRLDLRLGRRMLVLDQVWASTIQAAWEEHLQAAKRALRPQPLLQAGGRALLKALASPPRWGIVLASSNLQVLDHVLKPLPVPSEPSRQGELEVLVDHCPLLTSQSVVFPDCVAAQVLAAVTPSDLKGNIGDAADAP